MGDTYRKVAQVCHEANRALCETQGDHSQSPWESAPDWQRESAIDGVMKIAIGEVTRPEQSHESWLAEKERTGWKYGPVKNPVTKEHPCFVPYDQLPPEQRVKDHLYFAIAKTLLGHEVTHGA